MTIIGVNTQDVTDISSRCPHKIVNEWFLSEFLTPGVFHRERYVWERLINWIFCTHYSLITWFYSPLVPPLRIPVSLNWDPANSRVPISSDPCPRHTRPLSAKRTEDKGVLMSDPHWCCSYLWHLLIVINPAALFFLCWVVLIYSRIRLDKVLTVS